MLARGHILSQEELLSVVSKFDTDNGGTIGFEEFCRMADERRSVDGYSDLLVRNAISVAFPNAKRAAAQAEASSEAAEQAPASVFFDLFEDINEAFQLFDENDDGTIELSEMLNVLRSLGQTVTEDELRAIVSGYDDNQNGRLDFDEFCKMVGEGSVASSWALPEGVDGSVVKMVSEAAREAVSKRRARLRAMLAAVDAPPSWE